MKKVAKITKKRKINGVKNLFIQVWLANPKYVILSLIGILINIPTRIFNLYTLGHVVIFASEGNLKKIVILCMTFFIYMLIIIIGRYCFVAYKMSAEEIIREKLKVNIYNKLRCIDVSAYDDPDFYDIKSKVIEMSDSIILQCYNKIIKWLRSLVSACTYVGVLLTLSPLIIIIVGISCGVAIIVNFSKSKYAKKQFDELTTTKRRIDYIDYCYNEKQYVHETKIEPFSSFLFQDFRESYAMRKRIIRKYALKELYGNIGSESIIQLSDSLSWLYLGFSIINNKMPSAEFVSVVSSIWGLTQQLFNVFIIFPQLYADGLFAITLDEFFNYESKIKDSGTQDIKQGVEQIELHNVGFSYNPKFNVLSNINFIAQKGESIAIVGQNGAGKSTLMKLILRLYEPSVGNIIINGIDYKKYKLSCLQKEIATVFQECNIYAYSVAENILMHKCENNEDEQKVEELLIKIGLWDKVKAHPLGVHASIYNRFNKDGIQFSGGELQKLTIARALSKSSSIIILDEPTASLDALSENGILQLLNKECGDKILILISHKLSLIKDFSQIIVVDNGQILERGTHIELLNSRGLYHKMWETQAKAYEK